MTFFLFEEWEDEQALARHFETEHMKVFRKQLPGLVAGNPTFKRYEVERATVM